MRVVLDSNVLLSALLTSGSACSDVVEWWREGRLDVITSEEQIEEIARVTRYPKISRRMPSGPAGRLAHQLREVATVVAALPKVSRAADPDEGYLLALAEAGGAEFLVTEDKGLLALKRHGRTRIVAPGAFAEMMKGGGGGGTRKGARGSRT